MAQTFPRGKVGVAGFMGTPATIHAPAPMPHLSRSQRLGDLALGLAFAAFFAFFAVVITHG